MFKLFTHLKTKNQKPDEIQLFLSRNFSQSRTQQRDSFFRKVVSQDTLNCDISALFSLLDSFYDQSEPIEVPKSSPYSPRSLTSNISNFVYGQNRLSDGELWKNSEKDLPWKLLVCIANKLRVANTPSSLTKCVQSILALHRKSKNLFWLVEVLETLELSFGSQNAYWSSYLGGVHLTYAREDFDQNLIESFLDLLEDLNNTSLEELYSFDDENYPLQSSTNAADLLSRILWSSMHILGFICFGNLSEYSTFLLTRGAAFVKDLLSTKISTSVQNKRLLKEDFMIILIGCHIFNCASAINTEFKIQHSPCTVNWMASLIRFKCDDFSIEPESLPVSLVEMMMPDLTILELIPENFRPIILLEYYRFDQDRSSDYCFQELITVNFLALSMSYHQSVEMLPMLELVFLIEPMATSDMYYMYILNILVDKSLLNLEELKHIWPSILPRSRASGSSNSLPDRLSSAFAYLLCSKILLEQEDGDLFYKLVNSVIADQYQSKYFGLLVLFMDQKHSLVGKESLLLLLDYIKAALTNQNNHGMAVELHSLISSLILLLKKGGKEYIPGVVDLLVKYSVNPLCFAVLELFMKHTVEFDILGIYLDRFMQTIQSFDRESEATEFIKNGAKFFSQRNINHNFVLKIIKHEIFRMLLDEMDRLADKGRLNQILVLMQTIGNMMAYDPLLCEDFVNSEGFDRIFDLYLKLRNNVGFLEFYLPILLTRYSGIEYLNHSAGIDYLFVKKASISLDDFKSVYTKILSICPEDNFWNLNICRNARLVRSLLSSLEFIVSIGMLEETADFMVKLLQFHVDFDDIKALLSGLKPSSQHSGARLPWHYDMILSILIKTVSKVQAGIPRDYFLFPSVESQFCIPPISNQAFSESTGYSVFLSLNIHSGVDSLADLTLFRLIWKANGFELNLVLSESRLELRTIDSRQRKSSIVVSSKLKPLYFYSIMLTHQIGMFNLSKESIYLNGELIWKGSLSHPLVDSDLTFEVAKSNIGSPMPIYLCSFALFNTTVSLELIRSLHFSNEISLPISSELYKFQLLPVEQQPILFFHPLGICDLYSESCFNISNAIGTIEKIQLQKILAVTTRSILDALQSIGSFELLYPMLNHATLPIDNQPNGQKCVFTHDGPRRIVEILRLYSQVILQSPFHRNIFIRTKGPKLISLLLQQMPPSYLSTDIYDTIEELKMAGQAYPGLVGMLQSHLLFEPQIWARSRSETQRKYFEKVKDACRQNSRMEYSRLSYWLDCTEQFFGDESGQNYGWELIKYIASHSKSNVDIQRFVESLWCCIHSPEGTQLYETFYELYEANEPFYESILTDNRVNLLYRMLQSVHESVRLASLKIMERTLMNDSNEYRELKQDIVNTSSAVLGELLSPFPLTRRIYLRLLNMALEVPLESFVGGFHPASSTFIKYPAFLTTIIDLLVNGNSKGLENVILKDLSTLLSVNSLNSKLVDFEHLVWQLILFMNRKALVASSSVIVDILVELSINGQFDESVKFSKYHLVVVTILVFFEMDAAKIHLELYFSSLIRRLNRDSERLTAKDIQDAIKIVNVTDSVLVYFKNIATLFKETYGTNLGDANLLLDHAKAAPAKKSKHVIAKDQNWIYQPTFPFDEWPLVATDYFILIQSLLQANPDDTGFYSFSNDTQRMALLVQSVHLIVSSLNSVDNSVWDLTLAQLVSIISEKERLAPKIVYFMIGSLIEALKSNKPIVLVSLGKVIGYWNEMLVATNPTWASDELESMSEDLDSLQNFVSSKEWLDYYDKTVFPAAKLVEKDMIENAQVCSLKYLDYATKMLQRRYLFLGDYYTEIPSIMEKITAQTFPLAEMRKARMADLLSSYEIDNREISQMWHFSAEVATYDRRTWQSKTTQPYYCLDITENSQRMRQRMFRNYDGKGHELASSKRDRVKLDGPIPDQTAPFFSLPDRKMILIHRLAKLDFQSGSMSIDEPDDSFEPLTERTAVPNYLSQRETCLHSFECEVVLLLTTMKGRLEITNTHVRFLPELLPRENIKSQNLYLKELRTFAEHRRALTSITRIFLRRYKLRNSALEAFFTDGHNYFFNFLGTEKEAERQRKSVLELIQKLGTPNLAPVIAGNPIDIFAKTGVTQKWINREISNFDYLMALNTYSGRTYNDITQYPVFPWIIKDYESSKLDLNGNLVLRIDPSIYRDLSKPMGAINEQRLKVLLERYESFEDPNGQIPKFMYGSHYSSSASVVFYLLRLEPFTSFHISLQGGKFDVADRQFRSFKTLWESVTTSTSDVKELIPEFFYFPDFLRNMNSFDLGVTQSGLTVDDVVLPPWASSPEEFIRINRDALESEYVSENLHNWIDLIWGHKQTGKEAVKAHNVFYYLTYENAVNIDLVQDERDRKSIEDQVHHFGQTPSLLFKQPHPKRMPKFKEESQEVGFYCKRFQIEDLLSPPVAFVIDKDRNGSTKLLLGDLDLAFCTITINQDDDDKDLKIIPKKFFKSSDISSRMSPYVSCPKDLAVSSPRGDFIFVGGYFDYSFRLYSVENGQLRIVDKVYDHLDIVTCMDISEDGEWLATGSKDSTVRLWNISYSDGNCVISRENRRIFYAHDAAVSNVIVNTNSQLLISSSKDGTVVVHPLRHVGCPVSIDLCALHQHNRINATALFPESANVLVATQLGNQTELCRYSINGRILDKRPFPHSIFQMKISNDSQYVFLSTPKGLSVLNEKDFSIVFEYCIPECTTQDPLVMTYTQYQGSNSVHCIYGFVKNACYQFLLQ